MSDEQDLPEVLLDADEAERWVELNDELARVERRKQAPPGPFYVGAFRDESDNMLWGPLTQDEAYVVVGMVQSVWPTAEVHLIDEGRRIGRRVR